MQNKTNFADSDPHRIRMSLLQSLYTEQCTAPRGGGCVPCLTVLLFAYTVLSTQLCVFCIACTATSRGGSCVPGLAVLFAYINNLYLYLLQSLYSAPVAAAVFLAYTIPSYLLAGIHYPKLPDLNAFYLYLGKWHNIGFPF